MAYKVRPFTKSWGLLGITASGELWGGRFFLRVGKADYVIPTTQTGSYHVGEYAFVEDQRVELGFGWSLSVEPELDEDDARLGLDPGCCVKLEEIDGDAIRRMGIDPRELNVNFPPRFSISVHFDSGGQFDGFGGIEAAPRRDDELH